jgi:uncharacterized repeat protein (TIGR03803 family)
LPQSTAINFNYPREDYLVQSKRLGVGRKAILAMVLAVSATAIVCAQETVLHSFDNNDGMQPVGGVIFDASGNLYGTTFYGGTYGSGTVYELTPGTSGWTETVLHSFNGTGLDGSWPNNNVVLDASGNIYGTTFFGGAFGVGTVFELSAATGGGWTEKILHNFTAKGGDGTYPHTGLVFDTSGNLYGTASGGGANSDGIVFELSPAVGGGWTESVFSFSGTNGAFPYGGVIIDGSGNLYGTTSSGGSSSACHLGCGTVYELTPIAGGGWTEKVLHSFNNTDGANPAAAVVFDAAGHLFGMTGQGGAYNYGGVFELVHTAGGSWRAKILHNFNNTGDGYNPAGALITDAGGNVYGTTSNGGAYGHGTVFELKRSTSWSEKILYSFSVKGGVGAYDPFSGVTLDAAGNLYGTAESGGANGDGAVFEIKR